ncbi:major facilitator superfamily domain-containing protein 10 isoform X2 [Bos indicus]|uniref:Major facilitator superfamily domain-containing protein 10 isoform X2 n=1 Tax=Bos indicus TaxID=9915 RepID=A0ABM4SGY1_BOSIN
MGCGAGGSCTPRPPIRQQQAPETRVVAVVFLGLLLDLLAFTLLLPLLPGLLESHGRAHDPLYGSWQRGVDWFAAAIGMPAEKRYNSVLFGGLIGSVFSLLQFLSAPLTGALSDCLGRRPGMLLSLAGVATSYAVWAASKSFAAFLASRVIGGISKGNVSLCTAIVADLGSPSARSKGMAVIGVAFSLGFTLGPTLGAFLPSETVPWLALLFAVSDLLFIWCFLPETLPPEKRVRWEPDSARAERGGDAHHVSQLQVLRGQAAPSWCPDALESTAPPGTPWSPDPPALLGPCKVQGPSRFVRPTPRPPSRPSVLSPAGALRHPGVPGRRGPAQPPGPAPLLRRGAGPRPAHWSQAWQPARPGPGLLPLPLPVLRPGVHAQLPGAPAFPVQQGRTGEDVFLHRSHHGHHPGRLRPADPPWQGNRGCEAGHLAAHPRFPLRRLGTHAAHPGLGAAPLLLGRSRRGPLPVLRGRRLWLARAEGHGHGHAAELGRPGQGRGARGGRLSVLAGRRPCLLHRVRGALPAPLLHPADPEPPGADTQGRVAGPPACDD